MDFKTDGFYVDIGCFHPIQLSNTWLLYQNKWKGICADPNPNLKPLYDHHRPRDVFESVAISREPSIATFYLGNHGVHSSLNETENSSGETIQVPVERLQTILERNNAPKIDLLTIDAEGVEIDILESFDWEQYTPRLVIVEYNSAGDINTELQKCLIEKGYHVLFINNWNFIFTSDFVTDSQKLYRFQKEGALFAPIAAKIKVQLSHEKTRQEWEGKGYIENPIISFVIQCHNKSEQVVHLINKLKVVDNAEIIVIDDGSEPYHTERLIETLSQGNHFLLRSNDLYEVITYDRAIYLARGHLVVLMQDDDDFEGYDWIQHAVTHFSNIPKLAILGGRMAIEPLPFEKTPDGTIGEFTQNGRHAKIENLMSKNLGADPDFPEEFQYTPVVVRAPMWIRRDHFIDTLKHIDQAYAPFLVDDHEICLRAWLMGLKVAYYPAHFKIQKLGTGGMRIWNNKLTKVQATRNYTQLYQVYGKQLLAISEKVKEENRQHYLPQAKND